MAGKNTITTQGVLIINGKQVENTFSSLNKTTRKLEAELRKLKPGTQEFIDKAEQVKLARKKFAELKDEINATTGAVQKATGFFSKLINLAGGLPGVMTILGGFSFKKVTDNLLNIADAITAVQKTSGLAQQEVEDLWKSFANTDTRTSREELLKIAEMGGRLGINDKEQLRQFTEEIDKIYVALGDSFQGGLEAVTIKVGKLKNLFDETKNTDYGQALNEIGSALNELGANGTASEENITEFATRMGQLPSALKPSISAVLGMGAAFEEAGVDAQIASSGYSRFVSVAGNNLEAFAGQMKISTQEARELFNTQPEVFFLKFAQSIQGLEGDQSAGVLKKLNLNTLEIQKTLGAAGANAGRFAQMMELSAEAMSDAASIQQEFDKVNNNSAAIWEKIGRAVKEFVTDGFIPDFFNWLTQIVGKLTGVVSEAGDGMERFRGRLTFLVKTITVATVAFLSYKAAVWLVTTTTQKAWQQTILYNTVTKINIALKKAGAAATYLWAGAKALLAGNIGRATAAMRLFNIVIKMSPAGLFAGIITATVAALILYSDALKKVSFEKKSLNEAERKANEDTVVQKNNLEQLLKTARDKTKSDKERQEAVDALNKSVPEYNNNLTIESAATQEATEKLGIYIEKIKEAAREKFLKALVDQKAEEVAKAENSTLEDNIKWYEMAWNGVKNLGNVYGTVADNVKTATENKDEWIARSNEELEIANKLHQAQKSKNSENGITVTDPIEPPKPDPKPDPKTPKIDLEKIKEERTKAHRALIALEEKHQDELMQVQKDSFDKQLTQLETEYERKKRKITEENEDIANEIRKTNAEIAQLNEQKANTKNPKKRAEIDEALAVYDEIQQKRVQQQQANNRIIESLDSTHQFKINAVKEKAFTENIKLETQRIGKIKEARTNEINAIASLEEAKAQLADVLSADELSKIKTISDAKKALREQANKEALDAEITFIEEKTALLRTEISETNDPAMVAALSENLDMLTGKLQKLRGDRQITEDKENADDAKMGNDEYKNADILGFSTGQWEEMFANLDTAEGKLAAVGMAMQALANAGQLFAQSQRNANERELRSFTQMQERRKDALIKNLNEGYITQEEYHNGMLEMDRQLANKKAEMEYKQAKAEKTANLMSAIGNVALGVSKALTAGFPMGAVFAAIIGALGAVQIATIASQPLPPKQSYAQGGYTEGLGFKDNTGHEVAGAVHAGEYVIPAWMMKEPQVASVAGWLEAKRNGNNRSFNEGGYAESSTGGNQPSVVPQTDTQQQFAAYQSGRLADILEKLDKNGITAYLLADAQNGKKMSDAIDKFKKLENKNKR